MFRPLLRLCLLASSLLAICFPAKLSAEAMLQYFNTSWKEISDKMPELAEAGYDSLWLPPPTKGSGGLSVGYDLWDRFDLGSKDQRGSVSTCYGTEAELLRLVETAHRFGIRIYFDNIMNHNAFDIPGYNADTPIDIYPGFVPEDFHLRVTEDGFYRKWDNTRNWGDAWQVQNLGLADLIDIAQEPGGTNQNFGASEGSTATKIKFVRSPNNPEYYCFHPTLGYVGFNSTQITAQVIQDNQDFYSERVEDYLNRTARWLMDRAKADGLRLDAVKHVRADFFGATYGANKDFDSYGYLGQAQDQFNKTRGFTDGNHRDTVFDTEKPRDDAMMFGEHLGEPPGYGSYFDAGMRLVDNVLRQQFNDKLGNPSNGLNGFDQEGAGGFAASLSVMHAQSHDNDYASRRELQHAFYFTRAGIGLVYTDGNHHAETLGESGGAFPRHANTAFLGQWNDARLPNLLYIHNQFARGYQKPVFSDGDFVAYERLDKTENSAMSDADAATMLIMLNDNYANGQARSFATSFPATQFGANSYLYNYSTIGGGFYKYASELSSVVVPPGGYFVFSWKNPDPASGWTGGGGSPVTILQNGQPVGTVSYDRKDGPDGDPGYNPNAVADPVTTDFKYSQKIPRVTNGTSLSFLARPDASAQSVLFKLDGGIDLNGTVPAGITDPGLRDFPPGINRLSTDPTPSSTDVFMGYEASTFVGRQYGEKFAAVDSTRCKFGSSGAETYFSNVSVVNGPTNANDYATDGGNNTSFVYHAPNANVPGASGNPAQLNPATGEIWAKTNEVGAGYKMFVYYTTDGTNPEGAGGVGLGTTLVGELGYHHNVDSPANNWWMAAVVPGLTNPNVRYKISSVRTTTDGNSANAVASVFPSGATEVTRKDRGMTTFKIDGFNATTKQFFPHNDYAKDAQGNLITQTGLSEGFHVIRARSFLKRDGAGGNGRRASIYNTFTQTFYYDAQRPGGEIKFPTQGQSITDSQYGVVVRTDPSVTEVWYNIADLDSSNDDSQTKTLNGNGGGFEPFTDSNQNGIRDSGEVFEDLNGNSQWDGTLATSWVRATEVTPTPAISSSYQREWRFDYRNLASGGNPATINVRLRELSSDAYANFGSPGSGDDVTHHYTTLQRTVTANGPVTRLFVAYPQGDGETIGTDYKVKIRFSKSLADNLSEAELITKFLVKIASSESGSASNGVTQGQSNYEINYNVTNDYHELQFPKAGVALPNLYNGQPDFLHTFDISYTRSGYATLNAKRMVKFAPTVVGPFVNITNPPEFNGDGQPHEIVLPDVASPTAEQRQFSIQVETDLNADNVSVAFQNSSATAPLAAQSEVALSGNVSVTAGSNVVTGTGTNFTTELSIGNAIKIGAQVYTVFAISSATSLTLSTNFTGTPATTAYRVDSNPAINGNRKLWSFLWSNIAPGNYTFTANVDTDSVPATTEASATRNTTVVFRQSVTNNPADIDDDDDGLLDVNESTAEPLPNQRPAGSTPPPEPNPETWDNGEVHVYNAFGQSSPLNPDTDADGLPDGLEVGWRASTTADTNTNADTNGDGIKNFIGDLDPPFYNTLDNVGKVPAVNTQSEGGDRALKKGGTTTDPNNPDSDGDGIKDGVEDANRNGWVDGELWTDLDADGRYDAGEPFTDFNGSGVYNTGDGQYLPPSFTPYLARQWPNGKMDPLENWTETAPTVGDSDADGLSDGFGEDKNFNGMIDGDNGNRVYNPGEAWLETNPLSPDSDGDGLADGWEVANGLDPLDNGTDKFSTSVSSDGTVNNGAIGDPDGDTFTNSQEQSNGTDPHVFDTGNPPPAGSITIGPVPEAQKIVVGGVTNYKEFTDWTADDLIVLDEYEGGGTNNQGGDIFPGGDGFDSSRDLVAFYARDGGADGNYYFRVDMQDLRPYAEDGYLDIYVAIDTNSPGDGERKLPDDVDELTDMRWEAVVACYSSNNGRVYVDTNRGAANNSTTLANDIASTGNAFGVKVAPGGFKKAYYNSDLDAVEFSISRAALTDLLNGAGWNGTTPLNFQVFTTRDGTGNSPVGAGDIGGRNDIRDTIYDDFQAEDYYNSQAYISQEVNAVLKGYFGRDGSNDRGKRTKVISLLHGNQAIQPGNTIQTLINTGASAGYYRPLDVHEAFGVPLALHVTPTLASAIEWAKVDPAVNKPWRDGPSFNARIETLAGNGVIDLLGSTFSDHVLAYFPTDFNSSNVGLADEFLTNFYGSTVSQNVFWNPERVANTGVLAKISSLGFNYTFIDQMRHVLKWFGRTSALSDDGYRINLINGTRCIVINDQASTYRFQNSDNGLATPLRELFSRKARSGTQDQVVVLFSPWEDFGNKTQADAYDKNIRWIASRPWIELITPDQIANAAVDISVPPDGQGDVWPVKNRASDPGLANVATKVAHDFIDHATEENYDNWYNGLSGREESLRDKVFSIRSGVPLPAAFGTLDSVTPNGIVKDAWAAVTSMSMGAGDLGKLAQGVAHAAMFETAFHDQTNNDLSKFSTGAYIYPDTDSTKSLAAFSKQAQAQARTSAIYKRVDTWKVSAATNAYLTTSVAETADVDLDGEPEYLLFNDRLFALFERIGGRLTAAWTRNIETGEVFQALGNQLAYAGSETEEEGNVYIGSPSGMVAYRTSGFKDWFADDAPDEIGYVNNYYGVSPAPSNVGWTFSSSENGASPRIVKTVNLAPRSTKLDTSYVLSGGISQTFVRFGLSPNLYNLLLTGQQNLNTINDAVKGEVSVLNASTSGSVRAFVKYGGTGYSATYNSAAVDRSVTLDTINMRNQAQMTQIEISGSGTFTFALGFQTGSTISIDSDNDGLPDWWETLNNLDPLSSIGTNGAGGNSDFDKKTNLEEYILKTNAKVYDHGFPSIQTTRNANSVTLQFPTLIDRIYTVEYRNDLQSGTWQQLSGDLIGTGGNLIYTDGSPPSTKRFYRLNVKLPPAL